MTSAIKPFRIDVSGDILADLKSRLARTRWPVAELVGDWSQGASLKWIQEICGYWANDYHWRACEAKLNRFDQFTTEIDGLDGIACAHQHRNPATSFTPVYLSLQIDSMGQMADLGPIALPLPLHVSSRDQAAP